MPNITRLVSIVDDDHSIRRSLRRLIQLAGFTAETFGSAEDFLSSASLLLTSCLVLDVHLKGGMGGFELQAQLAADRVVIPIIFITAHDDLPTRERAQNSGAAAYLCKPFNDELLLDAIRGALSRSDHRPAQGPNGDTGRHLIA